ncbi:MAG TPA: hypothetical protein VLW52_05470 [Opitutaceae bacterium]|nr:hypothetical protein [Opitutaceae bacterium]
MQRRRRLSFLRLLLVLALPAAAQAAGLEIVRVFTSWRAAASFQSVGEYLDGREHTGGIAVLRSQPGARAGYYWLVRLKNSGAAFSGAKFVLQVITPAGPEPKTFVFATAVPAGRPVFQLGLTGSDWPGAKARPVAWHLQLLAADGRTLLAKESFLWELPGKP